MLLRHYQERAKQKVYEHLRGRRDNPCVVIPTGGGKTPLLASICADAVNQWSGRVIVLAHVRELLMQSVDKLQRTFSGLDLGVYSAGLGRRDTSQSVIVAGIQSVYKRACELDRFDLAIVDEAHMIPADGEGMYRQFLAEAQVVNPHLRVIGMTATPFRLKTGLICGPDRILNHICDEVGIRELIGLGYLSPLTTKAGAIHADVSRLHVRGGEFVASEAETLMDDDRLVDTACAEIVERTAERKSVLIFATGVKHARHVVRVLAETHELECGFICGKTPGREREQVISRFVSGSLRYLCNINVLTTGFDAPNVDAVVLMRPTMSTGLYYQMVGRGFRVHPGKRDCLVLDFGGNVERHGPVDEPHITQMNRGTGKARAKECPACNALIATGYTTCPDCGHQFPRRDRSRHADRATDVGILSKQITDTEYEVLDVRWSVHHKRDAPADAPQTMRVEYRLGLDHRRSEWVCFEHKGYARRRAIEWWQTRSQEPVPATAARAVELAEAGALAWTEAITVRNVAGDKYEKIVGYRLGALAEAPQPAALPKGVLF